MQKSRPKAGLGSGLNFGVAYLKAHRTATSMAVKKGGRGRLIGRTKRGMNTKLHAICDSKGPPLNLFVTAGQVSDYIGARALLSSLPDVDWRRVATRYDRCPKVFLSAIALAATVIYWL